MTDNIEFTKWKNYFSVWTIIEKREKYDFESVLSYFETFEMKLSTGMFGSVRFRLSTFDGNIKIIR